MSLVVKSQKHRLSIYDILYNSSVDGYTSSQCYAFPTPLMNHQNENQNRSLYLDTDFHKIKRRSSRKKGFYDPSLYSDDAYNAPLDPVQKKRFSQTTRGIEKFVSLVTGPPLISRRASSVTVRPTRQSRVVDKDVIWRYDRTEYIHEQKKMSSKNRDTEDTLSQHLSFTEKNLIVAHLGTKCKVICSGICQLVHAEDGEWSDPRSGLICFIRDAGRKRFFLSLLEPHTDSEKVSLIWENEWPISYTLQKVHDHLLTFQIDGEDYGLNFYTFSEAVSFLEALMNRQTLRQNEKKRSNNNNTDHSTKRRAPSPPKTPNSAAALPVLDTLSPTDNLETTSMGNVSPSGSSKSDDKEKKKKKTTSEKFKQFFSSKKKKDVRLEIGDPTNFQHVKHLGLENMDEEQREALALLSKEVNIQEGNAEQIEYLKRFVADKNNRDFVRKSLREKRHPSLKPAASLTNATNMDAITEESEARKSPTEAKEPIMLADARDSMMMKTSNRSGKTPRVIKNASVNRRSETPVVERVPTPAPDSFKQQVPVDSLMHSEWNDGEATVSHDAAHPSWNGSGYEPTRPVSFVNDRLSEQAHMVGNINEIVRSIDVDEPKVEVLEEGPPLPERDASYMKKRSPLGRRATGIPKYDNDEVPPRLPTRLESRARLPDSRHNNKSPPPRMDSAPRTAEADPLMEEVFKRLEAPSITKYDDEPYVRPKLGKARLAARESSASPPPPSRVAPAPHPPSLTTVDKPKSTATVSPTAPPPPPPPPPPPDMLRTPAKSPVDSESRKSLLAAIGDFDHNKLRKSDGGDRSPRLSKDPHAAEGLMESIQKHLDKMRQEIGTDTESDDSSSEWSEDD